MWRRLGRERMHVISPVWIWSAVIGHSPGFQFSWVSGMSQLLTWQWLDREGIRWLYQRCLDRGCAAWKCGILVRRLAEHFPSASATATGLELIILMVRGNDAAPCTIVNQQRSALDVQEPALRGRSQVSCETSGETGIRDDLARSARRSSE